MCAKSTSSVKALRCLAASGPNVVDMSSMNILAAVIKPPPVMNTNTNAPKSNLPNLPFWYTIK